MNRKNDIEAVKNSIRNLIVQRNEEYDRTFNELLLHISSDEFRKIDRKRVIDGKKTWLTPIVISEMLEKGELKPCSGYSGMYGNAKRYRLVKHNKTVWTEDMDFMAGYETQAINTNSHDEWLSVFYTEAETSDLDRKWERLQKLSAQVMYAYNARRTKNTYIYE